MKPHAIFWAVAVLGTAADLISKSLVFAKLGGPSGPIHTVIPSLLNFRCAENTGGVFGVLPGAGYIFIPLSILALGVVYWFFLNTHARTLKTVPPLGLIIAGTFGNLYDRLKFSHVRDFIDFHIGTYHWHTFNIADACICIGSAVLIFLLLTEESLQDKKESEGGT